MEDLQAARNAMEQKTQRKRELINTLKGMNAKLIELRDELNKLSPAVPRQRTPAQRLMEQAEKMEFTIATSAYTPAQERAMLKELKVLQAQIGQSAVAEQATAHVQQLRAQLREALAGRAIVQTELDGLRVELEAIYQTILKAGAERAKEYAARVASRQLRPREGSEERSGGHEGRREGSSAGRGPGGESRRFGSMRRGPGGRDGRGRESGRSFNDARRQSREEERAEMAPYMKEVDPFVSLEEIAIIKKKPAKTDAE